MTTEHEYLNEVIKEGKPVSIYTRDGREFTGIIEGHDEHVIVYRSCGVCNMIYKHAVIRISGLKLKKT